MVDPSYPTTAKNRSSELKGRVRTAEEAQVGSFEMQVQHLKSVVDNSLHYKLVKIYMDKA